MIRGKAPLHDHDLGLRHDLGAFLARRRALALVASASATRRAFGFRQRPDIPNRSSRGDRQSLRRARVPSRPHRDRGPVPGRPDRTMRMVRWPMSSSKSSGIVRRDMRTNIAKTAIAAEGQAFDLEITLVNVRQACAPLAGRTRSISGTVTRSGVTRSTIFPTPPICAPSA